MSKVPRSREYPNNREPKSHEVASAWAMARTRGLATVQNRRLIALLCLGCLLGFAACGSETPAGG